MGMCMCEQEREEEGEGVIKELDLKSIPPKYLHGTAGNVTCIEGYFRLKAVVGLPRSPPQEWALGRGDQ